MTPLSKPLAMRSRAQRILPVCAAILALAPSAWAATTEISSQPLATLPNVSAAPNLLFILDNSGSMASAYMPDDMSSTSTYGFYSAQCNGTAYDPSHTYLPPVDYTNTSYTPPTYPTAYTDGYKGSGGGTHTASSDYYFTYSGSQTRMGWTYPLSNNAAVDKTTVFYGECNTSKSATGYSSTWTSTGSSTGPGYGVFTKVLVSSLTAAQQQNFVNWYSYYRTRTLMMRTSMGLAINKLDSNYNVGFTVISDSTAKPSATFLDVKSFSDKVSGVQSASSQKGTFYTDLYAATGNSNTPLRGALSKAGQYYADKANGQAYDPMQYACQRNYALLSTDGYWNTGTEVTASSSATGYGPYQMDNTTLVGNQDGSDVAPMKDSTFTATTTTTKYTTATNGATRTETTTQTVTIPWNRTATTTASTPTNIGSTKHPNYVYITTTQPQIYTETQTQTCTQTQVAQASYTHSVVTVSGTTTSTSDSTVSYTSWVNSGTASCTTTSDTGAATSSSAWSNNGSSSTSNSTTAGTGVTTYTPSASGSQGTSSTSVTSTSDSTPSVVGSYTAGTPSSIDTTTGGASDTLADIAEYYFKTDLRDSTNSSAVCTSTSSGSSRNVCLDDVPTDESSGDTEKFQHMNTFTLGLGVSGTVPYDSTVTPTSGKTIDWPTPTSSSSGGDATNVDDLWHAALNGRGHFYSVLSASDLATAINAIVEKVKSVGGSGSAASTSSLELVSGDNNRVYKASYTTVEWTGNLQAYTLSATDATIGTTATWSAQTLLDNLSLTARKVYFNKSGTLATFSYDQLSTAQKAYFDNLCSKSVVASQCTGLSSTTSDGTTTNLSVANSGTNLVNYLTGTRSYEKAGAVVSGTTTTTAALYRARTHLLGDIIGGAPVYVGKPPFSYADAGYADFVTNNTSRSPVVYAAANDGMLHAFSASTGSSGGTELWAFVPSAMMPNLYKLADASYSSNHQYFVDGAPVMGDVYINGAWKTILVGGFNDGGQGYYALDITDPANPAMLWEFSDSNLGLSYGNPVITKRKDGTWVVVFGSGYNNTGGDGNGHLFVVDAAKGTKLLDIPTYTSGTTKAGSTSTPSGLAKINAWIDDATDNTSLRFYGGDLLGNLWRFDIDNRVQPNQGALLLASFEANSVAQPITTRPQTVSVGTSNRPVVVVATGRYLGTGDTTNTDQQSIYAVADTLTSTGWGDPRSTANASAFVKQTLTLASSTATTATISDNAVDFTNTSIGGWYVDLPHSGERVFSNMALQLNTLVISTAIPSSDACTAGGSSWLYYLDVTNGGIVTSNPAGSQFSSEALVVGLNWVKDTSGNIHIIVQDSKGNVTPVTPQVSSGTTKGNPHRSSWRELTN